MALSANEQNQLKTLITREGGLSSFLDEVRALRVNDDKQTAIAALQTVVAVNVSDWAAVSAAAAKLDNTALYSVMGDISAAVASRDTTKLGPLFVALYATVRANYSL